MDTLGNCKEKMTKRTIGPRQGLNMVARHASGAWPAWRGGDFWSHRKPAGPATGRCGLPVKARQPAEKNQSKWSSTGGFIAQFRASAMAPCPP